MPSQDQLRAMGMSESEARGLLAVLGMEAPDSLDEPTDDSLSTDRTYSSKRALFEHNKQQGKIYEQEQFALFCQNYSHAEEQITIRPLFGKKTRVDAIGLDADGNIVIHEFKSSRTAPLTRNQNDAFPQIEKYGGVVVGKGKGIFVRGYPIPPGTKIKIIRAELPN